MQINKEQTFWNNFMNDKKLKKFSDWVGDSEAESKVFFYNYIKNKNFKSILDMGCGNATISAGLKKNNIDMKYVGVDSCKYFVKNGIKNNLEIIESDIRKVDLNDSSFDLVFGRHVVEHQPNFKDLFNEMIRIGKKECIHIFFIKPVRITNINYDSSLDLYHNQYSIIDIKKFLDNHPKINNYRLLDINSKENMLIMELK